MEKRNFLVYAHFERQEREGNRVAEAASFVRDRIQKLSGDFVPLDCPDKRSVLLLCRCAHDASWIHDDIWRPEKHERHVRDWIKPDVLRSDDKLFVIELASDFCGVGVGRGVAWLQHRLPQ